MKHFFMPLFLLLVMHYNSSAQMGAPKADDVAKVKARQMVIVLREEDPELIKKYQKTPQKLTEYKKEIATYNENIQKVAPQIWTFNSEVIFKPASEVAALQKSKNKEYAFTEFKLQKVKENSTLSSRKGPFRDEWVNPAISIHLMEKPAATLGIAPFMTRTPTEGELGLALLQLQTGYTNLESGVNPKELQKTHAETLKTKTLLLDRALLKTGLTEPIIKKAYPFDVEIADRAAIDQHILQQNPKYAVVSIAPVMGMQMLVHTVTDLETGNVLGYAAPGSAGSGMAAKDGPFITKESLTAYTKGSGK
jgi:hypothetical protein